MKLTIFLLVFASTSTIAMNVSLPFDVGDDGNFQSGASLKTCRWTNCNDNCPEGFQSVARQGGSANEKMIDHTHCNGIGVSQFCCPSNVKANCRWQGHSDSGRCTPDCSSDEVEVGSLRLGCKYGHQAACCSTGNTHGALEAYKQCKWSRRDGNLNRPCYNESPGYTPCEQRDYPNLVAYADAGFGGEQPCGSSGAKTFCCKDPIPPQFTNCQWYKKETHWFGDNRCEPSCPPNAIRLAIRKAHSSCVNGEEAYCCSGIPDWQKEIDDFREAVDFYKDMYEDDRCPWNYWPIVEDWQLEGDMVPKTETLQGPSDQGHDSLGPISPKCDRSWRQIVFSLEPILTIDNNLHLTPPQTEMGLYWNKVIVPKYGEGLRWSKLRNYLLNRRNLLERRNGPASVFIEEVLLHPVSWNHTLTILPQFERDYCRWLEPLGSTALGASSWDDDLSNVTTLNETLNPLRRTIDPILMGPAWPVLLPSEHREPRLGIILEGIINRHLTLHYARWEWYTGADTGNPPGPMLELAYWIGQTPGTWTFREERDLRLWRYRQNQGLGSELPQSLRDRWVVFHLHFDSSRQIFFETSSHRVNTRIATISMYHSAYATGDGRGLGDWRVEWRDRGRHPQTLYNMNRSVRFDCPWPPPPNERRAAFEIGHNRGNIPTDSGQQNGYDSLATWLSGLQLEGYLRGAGFGRIIRSYQVLNGNWEILPASNPIRWHAPGHLAYGQNFRFFGADDFRTPTTTEVNIPMPQPSPDHHGDITNELKQNLPAEEFGPLLSLSLKKPDIARTGSGDVKGSETTLTVATRTGVA